MMHRLVSVVRFACGQILLLTLGLMMQSQSAESPVGVELHIPPAQTRVIGDAIPLIWRFTNKSPAPLAFMWEGCCRLNGRLTVSLAGQALAPIPPGQALAHMFAKAERLDPAKPREFETRLSDLVTLQESGIYHLHGRYTGVLASQQPQVPRSLNLWREAAETPVIQVSVLHVKDYLAQRPTRSAARKLSLELAGPAVMPPLKPAPLQLKIANTSDQAQTVDWPHDVQLWMVNREGRRLGNIATTVEAPFEVLALPPGTSLVREIPFSSEHVEGESFGEYDVFIDLQSTGPEQPRVPSNPIAVAWRLTQADVSELVTQAASGAKTGLRNAPLKLLRVYLAEIRPALEALEVGSWSAAAAALAKQLQMAASLKPVAPKPGRVNLQVLVGTHDQPQWAEGRVAQCAARISGSFIDQLSALLAVRRHLGWELGVVLTPQAATTLGQIMKVVREVAPLQTELAAPPSASAVDSTKAMTNAIVFQQFLTPANLVLRLSRSTQGPRCAAARKLVDTEQPPSAAMLAPEEITRWPLRPLADRSALEELLADGQLESPQILILAAADIRWDELLALLEPVWQRGLQIDLVLAGHELRN